MVTQALFWVAIVPHGAPIPLANSQACVIPLLTQIRGVCVCMQLQGKLIWLENNLFFSESSQAGPVPPLGSQPHCASCCKGGLERQWEQEAMSWAVGTKPINHLRQHYQQMWNQGLPLYVLERNEGATIVCKQVLAYKPLAQFHPCAGHFRSNPKSLIAVTEVLGAHREKWEEIRALTKLSKVRSPCKRFQEGKFS